jgi:hypothetical protein
MTKFNFSDLHQVWDKKAFNGHIAGYKMNVFSISRLAFNPESIIKKKIYKEDDFKPNWNVRIGTSIHSFVQNSLNGNWKSEQEIWYDEPFEWKHLNDRRITIYGSIDAINFIDNALIEFKTSVATNGTITDYMLYQTAAYAHIVQNQFGSEFEAHIVKISLRENDPVIDYVLSQDEIEKGWNVILERAKQTAEKIDILLAERKSQ